MRQNIAPILVLTLLAFLTAAPARAEPADAGEARLRETLRGALSQLNTAEADRTALQASLAEATQKSRELTAQVAALAKQASADRAAADRTVSGLNSRLADRDSEVARLKEALEKLTASREQLAAGARANEARRAALDELSVKLERRLTDCQARNAALFKLGSEILTRYEGFSLGNALSAKEPFVGMTRTKLENLAQDYEDKLLDQKLKP